MATKHDYNPIPVKLYDLSGPLVDYFGSGSKSSLSLVESSREEYMDLDREQAQDHRDPMLSLPTQPPLSLPTLSHD